MNRPSSERSSFESCASVHYFLPDSISTIHSTMVSRYHRQSNQPVSKADLPTFNALDNGSKFKSHRSRHGGTVSLSQAVLLAAVSASLAAVLTAFGASHYLVSDRFDVRSDSVVTTSHTTQSTFSHHTIKSEIPTTAEKFNFLSSFGKMSDSMEDADIASLFEGRIQEPEFLRPDTSDVDDGQLGVVWLMSFPNSGTSFTIHLTREASNTTTATNYACEGEIKDKPGVPVFNSSENGPFFELIPDRFTNIPPKYILTKTHCGGFCSSCHPNGYLETSRSFQTACMSGQRGVMTDKGIDILWKGITYNSSFVKKAIHVVRHPLDNVVARFHLYQKREKALKNKAFTTKYPYNSMGFSRWCADQDKKHDLRNFRWIDNALADKLDAVPCRQEFFMYLQWHNLAFDTTRSLGLPTLMHYYDDYTEDQEKATERLLTFLELPRVSGGEPFSPGKIYRDYYTPEQKAAILDLIKEQASAETWNWLKDYDFS